MYTKMFGLAAALFTAGSQALPTSDSLGLLKRDSATYSGIGNGVVNSASNRGAWSGKYDISTDYYTSWPKTGVVREYWLTAENKTLGPDGFKRTVLTFNGTYPGPTLTADWGDTLRIHVTNNLEFNGTSVHWHGIRQLLTNEEDGANGVTQCPIAPGQKLTYEWTATQYGTSWYHSHFSLQYSEGLAGPLVINGPTTANYDEDLGPVMLTDWYHNTAFSLWHIAEAGGPPPADNGLINGHNVFDCSTSNSTACVGGGKRYQFPEFKAGKKYLLRLINSSTDTHFHVSLDGHSMTVVSADFVPIKPYTAQYVSMGIGQRYDVIIEANAAASSYWFRAAIQTTCSAVNPQAGNVLGIVRYSGVKSTADPTTTANSVVDHCNDEPLTSLIPYVPLSVKKETFSNVTDISVGLVFQNTFKWTLNGISGNIEWNSPTLLKLMNNQPFPTDYHVLNLPGKDEMYYFVIESALGITHPIHLHGHDFWILAQGTGNFTASATAGTNWANPMRRDVAMMPPAGYLVIGFKTDNPGMWLMHCHIAWHVSGGFLLQFAERSDEVIKDIHIDSSWDETCKTWDAYDASGIDPPKEDSGLKMMRL